MGLFKKKQQQTPQARDLEKAAALNNADAIVPTAQTRATRHL